MRNVVVLDCGIWIKFYLGVYGNKRTLFLENCVGMECSVDLLLRGWDFVGQ